MTSATTEQNASEQRVERRRQFRCQVICAAIYRHLAGRELRVFMEPEERNDLLHSELARIDFTPLEEHAASLRDVLLEKGWSELP